ncbi:MAG: FAD-dependent oxidoreductase [Ruminococcaceae bacterium]|nr:FAD-dependent oxidoreductase [Oscillospiraceae bacterium]
MLDVIIIGGGVAGMTAAIYAARARLDAVVLERAFPGGQALETPEIENYPAVPHTDGITLSNLIAEQAKDLGADIRTADVVAWEKTENGFAVQTANETLHSRALLIAAGATHRPLGVKGEDLYRGKGVSYCATCDGRFYKDKTVAVVGGGNTAVEDALYLSRLCKQVYLIHRRNTLRASRALQEQVFASENITPVWNTTVQEVVGDSRMSGLSLLTDGKENHLTADGVFVAVGVIPNNALFADLPRDEQGFLVADEDGISPTAGIFVAGDIRAKKCRQLITAAGDGAAAMSAIERYLNEI